MVVGVDLKALKNGNAGIAKYLRSILGELAELDKENIYCLFTPQYIDTLPTSEQFKQIVLPSHLPGTVWLQLILPFALKKYNCNILWAPEQCSPVFMPQNFPVVTTIHDLASLACPKTLSWSNLLIQKLFIRNTIFRSKQLIAVSAFTGREIYRWFPSLPNDRVSVAPNGGPEWKDSAVCVREDYFLCVGSIEPRKNIQKLLEAALLLRTGGTKIRLKFVGPAGWKNSDLFSYIENNALSDQIEFLGYVTVDELEKLYSSCAALIFPSIYEGFGLPVLEAISRGTPVLTSAATVMEEICGELAHYFDPSSSKSIAAAIETFLTNRTSPDEKLCREKLSDFSWSKSAKKHLDIFESLFQD